MDHQMHSTIPVKYPTAFQGKTVEVRAAATGAILFSYKTGRQLFGASVISNGFLYTPSTNGSIYAFTIL